MPGPGENTARLFWPPYFAAILQVRVELFVEQMYLEDRRLAVTGSSTCVAVDDQRRPTPIRPAEVAL